MVGTEQGEIMATRIGKRITGKALEGRIKTVASLYEFRRTLMLEKVDPPSYTSQQFVQGKSEAITRLAKNPFPDFVGTWTERAGRALFLEAKTTTDERIALGGSSGITETQLLNLQKWEKSGAACGVIWECNARWRFVTMRLMRETLSGGRKSLLWEWAEVIPQGPGILFDFVTNLRRAYPAQIIQPAAKIAAPSISPTKPEPNSLPPAPGRW